MNETEAVAEIRALARPGGIEGLMRYGVRPRTEIVGTRLSDLRALARRIGRDHDLAVALYRSGVHEARLLAVMVADPGRADEPLAERWAASFDAWDLCDVACGNLFDRRPWAVGKALEWSRREPEFEKRAGFALMASLALKRSRLADDAYGPFLAAIERESDDDRNFVKKAVNWALRQIGKRNSVLRAEAIETARQIEARGTKAARWIARDALRELEPRGAAPREENG